MTKANINIQKELLLNKKNKITAVQKKAKHLTDPLYQRKTKQPISIWRDFQINSNIKLNLDILSHIFHNSNNQHLPND